MTKAKDNLNYNKKKALNLVLAIMKRAIIKASKITFDKHFTKQKALTLQNLLKSHTPNPRKDTDATPYPTKKH